MIKSHCFATSLTAIEKDQRKKEQGPITSQESTVYKNVL